MPQSFEAEPAKAVGAKALPASWTRVAALALVSAATLFAAVLLAYELAVARVPQHRAALEHLVRAHTGLDVRFNELGLRWGWYGPEAVFRRVELGEPGGSSVLLRAPELIVGFDAWRTLRSGQLEAGRITLVTPDIDFERVGSGAARMPGADHSAANLKRARILQRWRGGRIDIEGGTLRLPDPGGSANPFTLQIRRASLRRDTSEWSAYGLVFLPERLGRTARVALRLVGDLGDPRALGGTLRFDGRRLLFAGWRDVLGAVPDVARCLPRAGGGDVELHVDFEQGRIVKADGKVRAGGVEFDAPAWAGAPQPSALQAGAAAASTAGGVLALDYLRGEWRLARRDSGWRVRVEALELAGPAQPSASITATVDAALSGEWVRGKSESAPLQSLAAIGRWLAPHLQLAGVELGGTARDLAFDWNAGRAEGARLQTSARLDDLTLAPPSHAFTLTGLSGQVSGGERELVAELDSRAARLELARAPQYPLQDVRLAARLRISRTERGWQVGLQQLEMQHERARLSINGALSGDLSSWQPSIAARAVLTGADVAFVERLLGEGLGQAFGAGAARLTGGRIESAQFELRGAVGNELLASADANRFSGSVRLRDATLSGGELWPDADGVDARIDWHGSRIHALIEKGRAGPLQLESAKADWDARGERAAHLAARLAGPLQEALAWLRNHPQVQQYTPRIQDIDLAGEALLDLGVTVPAMAANMPAAHTPDIQVRATAVLSRGRLQPAAGIAPIEAVRGTLAFDAGHLLRSTLTGTWLDGPVTLRVSERREHGLPLVAIQGRGLLPARQIVLAATARSAAGENADLEGNIDWSGELAYLPGSDSQPPQWRVRLDSNLVGVASGLAEPLAKAAGAALALHMEALGTAAAAQLRVSLGDRLRGLLALQRGDATTWRIERGDVRFGTTAATLPAEPVVLVEGRVSRLDLPAYIAAWDQLRQDPAAPAVQAQLIAGELWAAGRSYSEVTLLTDRTAAAAELQLQSPDIAGVARWPAGKSGAHPLELHFTRLSVPERTAAGGGLLAALGPATDLVIDDLIWEGHSVGRFAATLVALDDTLDVSDMRLTGSTQEARGTVHCQNTACRLKFSLDSSNAAATLEDFGFRPDLTAAQAALDADVEWQSRPDQSALATLGGRLNMRLEDGVTRAGAVGDTARPERPFALLSVPALVSGMTQPGSQAAGAPQPAPEARQLRFARLEADFDLRAGQASTSNLHFDGDAEILMRGRTGLLAHDYDQQVWILRGEDRLPAAVRRLAPTPRVAAVWLSLRELFTGAPEDRSRAVLRLQGSWDDPVVVAAD